MGIAVKAYEQLIKNKQAEIKYYFEEHREIVQGFLSLQKELSDLSSRKINASLNEAEEIIKNIKPRVWTQEELDDQLDAIEQLAGGSLKQVKKPKKKR